jgi:hypothetical protein
MATALPAKADLLMNERRDNFDSRNVEVRSTRDDLID